MREKGGRKEEEKESEEEEEDNDEKVRAVVLAAETVGRIDFIIAGRTLVHTRLNILGC